MTSAPAPSTTTVRAGRGDTLRGMASRFYKDERLAELLALANPGLSADSQLPEGVAVRLPDKTTTQRWATGKGITVGVDPNRPSGTRQKRAWNKFQTGPSQRVASSPGTALGPEAALLGLLAPPRKDTLGPGVLTKEATASPAALKDAIGERLHWLGAPRVLAAAAETAPELLQRRAADAAEALGQPARAAEFITAVHEVLAVVVAQDVLQHARTLFARAQQALSVTVRAPDGGADLLLHLRDAEPDARVRLLTALSVPRARAEEASSALDRVPAVRQGLLSAARLAGKPRQDALAATGLPREGLRAAEARLVHNLQPADAEALALAVLGLEATAKTAHQGAVAMHTLVGRAVTAMKSQVDAASALQAFPAARAAAFHALKVRLDPWEFPPEAAGDLTVLDQAVLRGAPGVLSLARKLPDTLRVAWRSVEALGPSLGEVDASALGRGLGGLLARVAAPVVGTAETDVKKLRAGDLMSLSGTSAARAQVGVDVTRALAPVGAALAWADRFTSLSAQAAPGARLELRRRLVDGFQATYGFPVGVPYPPLAVEGLRHALIPLLAHAAAAYPDGADRAARVRPLVDKGPLVEQLVRVIPGQRYKFRRTEMSLDACWLLTAAWLLAHARALPAPADAVVAIQRLCVEDGGRVLDAVERELLKRVG